MSQMGQYTDHWANYRRAANRRTLQLLAVLICLPAITAAGYGLSQITELAFPIFGILLVAWLVVFTILAVRSTKVPCPQCSSVYSRGMYLATCPSCGLRMFQADPN